MMSPGVFDGEGASTKRRASPSKKESQEDARLSARLRGTEATPLQLGIAKFLGGQISQNVKSKHTQPFPADPKHQFPNLEPSFKEFLLEIVFAFCKLQASSLRSGLVVVVFLVSMNAETFGKAYAPAFGGCHSRGCRDLSFPSPVAPLICLLI